LKSQNTNGRAFRLSVSELSGPERTLLVRLALNHVLATTNLARLIFDLFERRLRPYAADIESDGGEIYAVVRACDGASERLRRRILRALNMPLDPKSVDRLLEITPKERLRWYKDGRLPTCGRSLIGHGNHQIMVPEFPVGKIIVIAMTPGLLASWRAQDDLAATEADRPRRRSVISTDEPNPADAAN
jgi:hypothetical protein